ncbi:hypothetical protein BC941DRAFT_418660 [Chlamydoabsidia padenii]|nr:hypothetical protein BC941DRAFT_418660 [Chlamydoabsidia padenii]
MEYNLQQSGPSGWMYSSHQDTNAIKSNSFEPLQEPVPFEDFQFSFGLEPGFAVPVPLDDLPPIPTTSSLNEPIDRLFPMDYERTNGDTNYDTTLHNDNNPLLDENDQKAFSQFLDAFFVDKDGQMANAEHMASQFSTLYDIPPPRMMNSCEAPPETIPYHVATSMFLPKSTRSDDDDEHRRHSILQSLDQQKQLHQRHNRLQHPESPNAIFLQRSNQVAAPFITKPSTAQRYHHQQHAPYPPPERQSDPHQNRASSRSSTTRRTKSHKELLTEEEKRNNHIASEQKRRSTIRNGFKDLTDIIPTLKNLNNSKSTVLFKAVDYIKYLENRNQSLREKMNSLEVRIKVEGRVSDITMHHSLQHPPMIPSQSSSTSKQQQQQQHQQSSISLPRSSSFTVDDNNDNGVAAALRVHKSQQQQLQALQDQLQYHQRLLTQEDDHHKQNRKDSNYNMYQQPMSSSSTTSSSSHSSPQSSDLYQPPPVASTRWTYDGNSKSNNSTIKMEIDNEGLIKLPV